MPEALTISTAKPTETALDYEALRQLAISHIEATASAIWTDYNVHDPGITTLEILCYAITDLAYRSRYAIPDLLTDEKSDPQTVRKHFFTARQIFPNRAVTINDYRKLLIDIEGVKNAWLILRTNTVFADLKDKKLVKKKPAVNPSEEVVVKGYYDVRLEFDIQIIARAEKDAIIQTAMDRCSANRNLCEDFLDVKEADQELFRLCAEIELAPSADVHLTLAQMLLNIQLHLNPLIKFYSLPEMLAAGFPTDEIFEGPLLQKGFIKDEELQNASLKTEIRLSDVMQEILNVEGIVTINEIIFQPSATDQPLASKWIIPVTAGLQPVVHAAGCNVLFIKEGMPIRPDMTKVVKLYKQLFTDVYTLNESKKADDIPFPTGRFKDAGNYVSIQHHFPKTYGISHWGLPADAPALRKVQAKQLQGYLWTFDQLLGNYLSQLSHLRNLFSLDAETQTYFTQLVDDFRGANDLFANGAAVKTNIQKAAEETSGFVPRRNVFLNHLLSRFAESFYDYASILESVFPQTDPKKLIQSKITFLKEYPAYSGDRFVAYDDGDAARLWDTDNISGLEKRLQRLLGFEDINRRSLVNLFQVITEETPADSTKTYRFQLQNNRTGDPILAGVKTYTDSEIAKADAEAAIAFAAANQSFKVADAAEAKFRLQLFSGDELVAESPAAFNTKEAAEAAAESIAGLAAEQSSEGMFLVEHLLLFPDASSEFLPICVDDNCEDCGDKDPYSFRISIVLPAYAPRFMQMDFRRYAERVIRTETPAHIFPKICWVSNEQLAAFEQAYRSWLSVKAGVVPDEDGAVLKNFITILTSLKTVYPVTRLQDCAPGEERNLFLLNQHALGTLK